ncbi:helix-turn-helix domain-containing GNAT family N-acetyltransferase [Nocardioides sp. YIM 152588]|uniref:bifunctional helix-turn-helix transcriptional regulator/GNAT family N-acetyltransferase n=1 Tax=Nocardioides sp. YIM 152588 TaxID=3158259 RepID=UPI0032E396B1
MSLTSTLRHFNRTYTQRIGVLEDSFLGTGRPLAASRVLFEVGSSGGTTVRTLRDRLGLDSGQLARLLRSLEAEGLVLTAPGDDDRRVRTVRLTAAGEAAYQDLERRSEERAAALVDPLTERQRDRLARALAEADLLVRAATVSLERVEPTHPAAVEATGRYVAELDGRFPGGFAPGGPDAPEPGAVYVVAISDGEPVAYGGVRPIDLADGVPTGEVKRMWVHGGWRGAGLGARMLRHLEQVARELGHERVVLDTNGTLTEAIGLYERAGYTPIERYNDNPYAEAFFTKPLSRGTRP